MDIRPPLPPVSEDILYPTLPGFPEVSPPPVPSTAVQVGPPNNILTYDQNKYDGKCLIYNETAPNMTKQLDADEDPKKMKVADTIHDMWNTERGEDVQTILNKLSNRFSSIPGGMSVWIQQLFNGNIINSKFEPKANSYFEARYNELPSLCRSSIATNVEISLQSIVEEGNVRSGTDRGPIWEQIINNPLINTIRISLPQQQEKKDFYENPLNAKGLNYTADFIMTFCGRPSSQIDVVFPIDATSGKLPDIFRGITNGVFTLATAMTIADSAGGGLDEKTDKKKRLIHFNKKYEPFDFPFNDANQKYYINSEYFTKDILRMYYRWPEENGQFSNKNQSGIKFGIEMLSNGEFKEVEFGLNLSGKPVSGVSVATLRDLMIIIDKNTPTNGILNVVNAKREIQKFQENGGFDGLLDLTDILLFLIDKFQNDPLVIIGFLCDYKRAGDYEQVNAVTNIKNENISIHPIFCTGDELCGLYSRSEKLNTAWSHGHYLDLFRFPTGVVDETTLQRAKTSLQYDILMRYLKEYFDYENQMNDLSNKNENNTVFNIFDKYSEKLQIILIYYLGAANKIAIKGLIERINSYKLFYRYIKDKYDEVIKQINELLKNNENPQLPLPEKPSIKDLILSYSNDFIVIDFFKDISRFTPVFNDVDRMKKYLEKYNTLSIEQIFEKNLPGPLTAGKTSSRIALKYIEGELFNYNLEMCNKFYELNEKIKLYNASNKRNKERNLESIKQVLDEYKTTVISILETYKYDIQTAENFEKDGIENSPNFGMDDDNKYINFDYIIQYINDIQMQDDVIFGKIIRFTSITNETIKNFIDEIFTLTAGIRQTGRQNGGNPGVNYNLLDEDIKIKYFEDELLTAFINISDECLNFFHGINRENEIKNTNDYILSLNKIDHKTTEYFFNSISVSFNTMANNIINNSNIELTENIDITTLPNSLFGLIAITNIEDINYLELVADNYQDETQTKKRKAVSEVEEIDDDLYFFEYNNNYKSEITRKLRGHLKNIEKKSCNNDFICTMISHIKTLYLQEKVHYLRISILLFFALSKKFMIDSQYVLNSDYISKSNLVDKHLPNYSLEKTYYDPYFDDILSEESYKLIKNIFSLKINNRDVSEYLNILMDVILIPFLYNIIYDQRFNISTSLPMPPPIQTSVLLTNNARMSPTIPGETVRGGNSKKNRRTKKKTSKTNKKNTRKAHPKKSNKRTKRKSRK
jgi:hypothetical protein